jgi:hypothetical protein
LRYTPNTPEVFDRTIWIFGPCIVGGYGVYDAKTIPSILQKLLANNKIENVRVVNFGGCGLNDFSDIKDFINMLLTDINKNDIIIHMGHDVWGKPLSKVRFEHYHELSWLLNRRHAQRIFVNLYLHLTPYGNEVIAKYIFDVLIGERILP